MTASAPWRSRFAAATVGALILVAVCWVQGLFPGDAPNAAAAQLVTGQMQCAHDMGWRAMTSYCDVLGIPGGFPYLLGLPWIVAGASLMHLPLVGPDGAFLLVGWLAVALGLSGGYLLMRRLGTSRPVSLLTTAVYLSSTSILGLSAFGPTWTGFIILPFITWANVWVIDRVGRGGWSWLFLLMLWPVSLLAVFTDGYSFVAGTLLVGCLWVAWAVTSVAQPVTRIGATAGVVAINLTAVAAYRAYVPGGGFERSPIDLIRAMGADVVTFVTPTNQLWLWERLGLDRDVSHLWGDGTNAAFNYLGVVVVALAVTWLVQARRRADRIAVAIAVAGVVALVLSLGPSLKLGDARSDALADVVTYESYLMPETQATLGLPTAVLFEQLPGMSDMRAAYRWILVTKFSVIVLAGLAVSALARSGRRALAIAVAALGVIEIAPNLPLQERLHSEFGEQIAALRSDLVPDLRQVVDRDDRVLFLPAGNDFMVDLLVPSVGAASYNAGGDKNAALAAAAWPESIQLATSSFGTPGEADSIAAALHAGTVDAVVLPRFDLRWTSYHWPPTTSERKVGDEAAERLATDTRLVLDHSDWFHVVRLAPLG